MDTTSNSPGTSLSPSKSPQSVSAFFESDRKAYASAKALTDAGFTPQEVIQTEQNGGYLVTVENTARAPEVAAILKQHGGSLSGDFSEFSEDIRTAATTDEDTDGSSALSLPIDSGSSDQITGRPAGGGTYPSGSSAGGSGSGTASGGSMFGSSR